MIAIVGAVVLVPLALAGLLYGCVRFGVAAIGALGAAAVSRFTQ